MTAVSTPESLEELINDSAIQRLWATYAEAVNRRDVERFVGVFTEDASWKRPRRDPIVGHDGIRDFMKREAFGGDRVLRHVNGHGVVTFESADRATGITTTTVYDYTNTGELPIAMTGPSMVVEYEDDLVRTDAGWRISSRNTTVVFAKDSWHPDPTKAFK
ncbi:MAG: hypothetical protein JWO10_1305 [Microbacteriaceae bacterium]|nr:hypothetical protein [Microbacteriaceae bacterium]